MSKVVLCLEEEAVANPSLIGLPDENLAGQTWLSLYTSAEQARRKVLAGTDVREVWVEGSDLVDPINLAATIKKDRSDIRVCLIAKAFSGSLLSRAHAASLDAVYDEKMFVHRYGAVKAALAHAAKAPGPARSLSRPSKRSAFLLTVVSGSGGAGKSTIAALAAHCAQAHGLKTVLVDFDLRFGNVDSFFKGAAHVPIDKLLAKPALAAKLVPTESVPAIVSAPSLLERSEIVSRQVAMALSIIEPRFDVVVANTGSAWSEEHAALIERSSKVLFLIDQRSSSLRACQHALDLCERCGIATGQFLFAANRCARDALYTSIDVSCALKGAESCELKDGGSDVEDCSSAGSVVDLLLSANPLYTSLEGVMAGFVPGIQLPNSIHTPMGKPLKWSWRRAKKGGTNDDAA